MRGRIYGRLMVCYCHTCRHMSEALQDRALRLHSKCFWLWEDVRMVKIIDIWRDLQQKLLTYYQ
jgi:hypothetical protein